MDSLNTIDLTTRPAAAARRRERGSSLVEASLVLPVFILLFLGLADFSVVLHDYLVAQNAARAAVRAATLSVGGGCIPNDRVNAGDQTARAVFTESAMRATVSSVTVAAPTGGLCGEGRVSVSIGVLIPIRFLPRGIVGGFQDVNFTARATAQNENFNS